MNLLRKLRFRAQRTRLDAQLDAEMQQHVELLTADLIAQGRRPEEARTLALRRFGNARSLREQSRESWGFPSLESFIQDLRFGLRLLARSPGFTLTAVLTLALGIGANTAVFSSVNALLLRTLPYPEADRLVAIYLNYLPVAAYERFREGAHSLDLASFNYVGLNLSGNGAAVRLSGAVVSDNFFDVLGIHAAEGRTFAPGDNSAGRDHLAILSNAVWKSRFSADPAVVGRVVSIDGVDRQIVGIMPAAFGFPNREIDVWIPLVLKDPDLWGNWVQMFGRVRPGVTAAQSRAEMKSLMPQVAASFPWAMPKGWGSWLDVVPMQKRLVGDLRTKLLLMLGAVALVLLIACSNVANLLLARAASRRREIAVRGALGAARSRILRQLLTESILLGLAGGSTGLALAYAAVAALRAALPPELPQPNPVTVGLTPLLFTFGVSLLVGILFGLVPALQSSSVDSRDALKSKGTVAANTGRRGQWLRGAFVVSEIALSLALLIGAGLLLRTFANLRATDVGVRPAKVLTASVLLPRNRYQTFDDARSLYQELLQKVRRSPGVTEAGITNKLPLRGGVNGYVMIPGQTTQAQDGPLVEFSAIDGDYFRVMGIPLLAGREFNPQDHEVASNMMRRVVQIKSEEETLKVANTYTLPAIINQTMARTFWPKEDALGKIFKNFATYQIIGIVGDVRQQSLRSSVMPEAYFPMESSLYSAVP